MVTPFHIPVTAAQVGTYFVGQYYQVLQQQPELVHQFYSDSSTMIRIDGTTRETAAAMLQIHALVMALKFVGIEIKTAHSLESWTGGVLVMVSGSVHMNSSGHRKFVQTFFLAPQEKGYFILNDIFHFIDEEQVHPHPAVLLAHSNLDSNLVGSNTIPGHVSNYVLGGEIQEREFVAPATVRRNGPVDIYSFPEQRLQQVPDSENILDNNAEEESNGSLHNTVNLVQDHRPSSAEEPVEPQKRSYASIVAKRKSPQSVVQPSVDKSTSPASEWNHEPPTTSQQSISLVDVWERSGIEIRDEVSAVEYEGEIKSVYVRNLPSNVSAYEIEEEFKRFGKLRPDGVVIRSRKDYVGVCYAFVEFEDITGVHNAVEAATVDIAGQQVHIEARRANSNIPSHGGRRGRGRGRGRGYQGDASRGRFGSRSYARGNGYDGGDQDYNRPRGNGFYRPSHQQDRGHSVSRQNPSESTVY